jgi:flagellar export protein FliJ
MAQFKFKLAAVLRHREAIEKEKQRDYALALARQKELEDQLKGLDQSMQASNDDVRQNHLVGRLDVSFITAHRRFLLGMRQKAVALATALGKAQQVTEAARVVMAEAAKHRMVLEKLREKQADRWKDEAARKEMAALDEVAMQIAFGQSVEVAAAEGDREHL